MALQGLSPTLCGERRQGWHRLHRAIRDKVQHLSRITTTTRDSGRHEVVHSSEASSADSNKGDTVVAATAWWGLALKGDDGGCRVDAKNFLSSSRLFHDSVDLWLVPMLRVETDRRLQTLHPFL